MGSIWESVLIEHLEASPAKRSNASGSQLAYEFRSPAAPTAL
jgi:hypothetical protein